jgi:hypothetical protein
VRASATQKDPRAVEPPDTSYIVLDDDDRIVYVGTDLSETIGGWVGQVLWDHLPQAADVYGPCFEEARAKGHAVESTVFYSGRVKRLIATPAADGLAVHVEPLAELNVRTLGTLTASLRRIEAALADPASEPLDPRAPASLRALP